MRILVVEDEREAAAVLARGLREQSFAVGVERKATLRLAGGLDGEDEVTAA